VTLRVAIVAGVTPDKWVRRWRDRFPKEPLDVSLVEDADQTVVLTDGRAQLSFVRLPVERDGLHLIPLWTEVQVVVLSREHPLAEFDALERGDLSEELVLSDLPVRQAVETVAAGTGIVFLPMSVARAHHRKDVVAVPVTDLAETQVGLAWRVDDEDPRIQEFIGIVRGRTERSSRGPAAEPKAPEKPKKQPAPKKQPPRKPASRSKRRPRRP
jgi:DNA-binding transcriptional LysR family regulator